MPTIPKAEDYRNLDLHVVSLADGRMVGIGEIFQLTPEQASDPHNTAMIADGTIVNCADWENAHPTVEVASEAVPEEPPAKQSTKKEGASA